MLQSQALALVTFPMEASPAPSEGKKTTRPSPRTERKTVERNRRVLMKSLFNRLDALLPHSKQGVVGLPERLDDASSYIRNLTERVDKLKARRDSMVISASPASSGATGAPALPFVEVKGVGSALEVVVVTKRSDRLVFYEIVRALEEEGVEVVNAGFSTADDMAFHTLHSLVTESKVGHEALHIQESLKKVIQEYFLVLLDCSVLTRGGE